MLGSVQVIQEIPGLWASAEVHHIPLVLDSRFLEDNPEAVGFCVKWLSPPLSTYLLSSCYEPGTGPGARKFTISQNPGVYQEPLRFLANICFP